MIWMLEEQYYRMADYLAAGGMLMYPLVAVSLVMWTLILNRLFFFRRLYRGNMDRDLAWECVRTNRRPDQDRYRGAVSLLVNDFLERRSGRVDLDGFILDQSVIVMVASLDRYLAVIGVLAGIAPLLGLLGTVTGMIATFDMIAVFGTGNARAMAGGISEALITTQTGLLVAIPGLYMKSFLTRRAGNLKRSIVSAGIYLRRQLQDGARVRPGSRASIPR